MGGRPSPKKSRSHGNAGNNSHDGTRYTEKESFVSAHVGNDTEGVVVTSCPGDAKNSFIIIFNTQAPA